jgi:hypothetical protein
MIGSARLPIANGVHLIKSVMIPMRDGVRLAADLYAPDPDTARRNGWEKTPVVMEYIPYRKDEVNPHGPPHYLYLPRHGYTVARVDIRGTGASEGSNVDEYTLQEQQDGYDAIEWIAQQSWCDGHVNMMGISYGGFTALQVASHNPPHLTSIIPVDFTDDRYTDDCHYRGGLLRMYYDIGWYGTRMAAWGALPPDPEWSSDWAEVWEQHLAHNEPYLLQWLRHQTDGEYWRPGSVRDFPERIRCPALLIGGWRDGYPNPPLRLFQALNVPKKVLIGPWNHAWPSHAIPGPRIDFLREVVRWLDHWCRGAQNGVMDEPPVAVYVQHSQEPIVDRLETEGEWRAETGWPPPRAQAHVLYLEGHDRLSDAPGADGADSFEYNPTVGVTGGLWSGGVQFGLPGDQRPDEALSLVYTTPPLESDLHLLGWPRVVLHIASSASVVGFAVSLSDVAPDGKSHLVAKGMLNATRRRSLREPEPLTPGEVVELEIQIDCTAWAFARGHRIRLSVASADWPNVWPTPEPAVNHVHHGQARPSRLILPVVPARGSAEPPAFAPSAVNITRHSEAVHPPIWNVTYDVLTGRAASEVQVQQSFRVNAMTTIEREFAAICRVDPRDPAHASARGWHVNRVARPNSVTQGRADTLIESTATHFHVTIDVEVRLNEAVHFQKRWAESIPREWL